MGKRDPRVDAYIANAADFAQPILTDVREAVHAACPDVEETMKWRFPHFVYKGMLCGVAAFKNHASLGFWKGALVLGRGRGADAMGHFGRITRRSDLPSTAALRALIKKAAALNEEGVKVPQARKAAAPKPVRVPTALAAAFQNNKKASAGFAGLSPSHKREYVEWITEAKTDETRARRLTQAIEWMAEGKSRNWKYEKGEGNRA
jgi:hypothetical protein